MSITLVSTAFSPDFSGEKTDAVSTFLRGFYLTLYNERYHLSDQRERKLRSFVLLFRDVSHVLNASEVSSISHVLPDWRADSPKTPRCAALSKVERSSDRSTEISLMVFMLVFSAEICVICFR